MGNNYFMTPPCSEQAAGNPADTNRETIRISKAAKGKRQLQILNEAILVF
jgi:hypothetical protein